MSRAFRRYLLGLWESRGGGFYGFVAAATFLYMEAVSLLGEFARIGRLEWFDLGWWIRWVISNLVEAALNSVWAALWPLTWVKHFGVGPRWSSLMLGVGLLLAGYLGAAYVIYDFIRPTVVFWLREPDEEELPPGAAPGDVGE